MDELEKLFTAYRDALPDLEPSAAFTPGVWRRIESRRSPMRLLRRMVEALVTVAALVTLLIGTLLIPRFQIAPVYSATYVDVLSAENSNLDYAEVMRPDALGEGMPQ
jgi:hypothetical protein